MSTQVNPSNAATEKSGTPVIVVGVDGSLRNRAAVAWAHQEAEDLGAKLVLVGASHEYTPPVPRFSSDYADEFFEDETRKTLEKVRDDLGATEIDMPVLIGNGGARSVLLRAADNANLLVVGKRGIGAAKRMMVGSNSIAVAGRSPVPVVVVPDAWVPTAKTSAAVVVGIDGSRRDDAVLDYAFKRALRLAVPLMAVYAWHLPAMYSWSPTDIDNWNAAAKDKLQKVLESWVERYPEVEVVTLSQDANAAMAILDAAAVAQLVVLGRHTGPHHLGGFHLGSTTRSVLHYAECPVAIVPSAHGPEDETSDTDKPEH